MLITHDQYSSYAAKSSYACVSLIFDVCCVQSVYLYSQQAAGSILVADAAAKLDSTYVMMMTVFDCECNVPPCCIFNDPCVCIVDIPLAEIMQLHLSDMQVGEMNLIRIPCTCEFQCSYSILMTINASLIFRLVLYLLVQLRYRKTIRCTSSKRIGYTFLQCCRKVFWNTSSCRKSRSVLYMCV